MPTLTRKYTPMPSQSALFQPMSLRSITLANRVVASPMCQYSALDGSATDWHLMHLGSLAMAGAGLLMIEATAVSAPARITLGCRGLYSDANEPALARVLAAVRAHALVPTQTHSVIGIQLSHAGRKASSHVPWQGGMHLALAEGGWQALAPSAVAHRPEEPTPTAMTQADIAQVVADFVAATRRAQRLGLQAIELHCAHGYLLHEFLSPMSNQRTDDYGGSLANRMRAPLQVFDAVRAAWPATLPLGVRVSATDWLEHTGSASWTLADSLVFANELQARGCDWIDVSSGGISGQQRIALAPDYQVHLAAAIKQASGLATMAVGLITETQAAEAIVADGQADMVALARALLWNPRWVWHAAAELGAHVTPPPQYGRAAPRAHPQVFSGHTFGQR